MDEKTMVNDILDGTKAELIATTTTFINCEIENAKLRTEIKNMQEAARIQGNEATELRKKLAELQQENTALKDENAVIKDENTTLIEENEISKIIELPIEEQKKITVFYARYFINYSYYWLLLQ